MKWDDSVKDAEGKWVRRAGFFIAAHPDAARRSLILTDYNNQRLVLQDLNDTELAEATPTTSGRRWLVKISTPGHKYGFTACGTKDQAIDVMLHRRQEFQGRAMNGNSR